jgi:hypothetical protein
MTTDTLPATAKTAVQTATWVRVRLAADSGMTEGESAAASGR